MTVSIDPVRAGRGGQAGGELPHPAQFDAQPLQPVDDADQRRLINHRPLQRSLGGLADHPKVLQFLHHLRRQ
jgi:hypothetical protein